MDKNMEKRYLYTAIKKGAEDKTYEIYFNNAIADKEGLKLYVKYEEEDSMILLATKLRSLINMTKQEILDKLSEYVRTECVIFQFAEDDEKVIFTTGSYIKGVKRGMHRPISYKIQNIDDDELVGDCELSLCICKKRAREE